MAPTPWWDPDQLQQKRRALSIRAGLRDALRDFFRGQGFDEVETPALQISPGMEVHLMPFATRLDEPFGQGARELYLHTSPEFAMKKLLAGGLEKIWQLARVYRNGERSARHHPEFTMLEWYRANQPYQAMMDDCGAILRLAAEVAGVNQFRHGDATCDALAEPERLTVAEAFARHAGIDLAGLLDPTGPAEPDPAPLARAAAAVGIRAGAQDRFEDVFFRVMLDRIEPHLGMGRATILCEYPACMAALARRKPGDPAVSERFELYVAGVEVANAFGELTDADEQRQRFIADMAVREALYGNRLPIDEDFLAAVAAMPEASGSALGFDRLVMLAAGVDRIDDVLWAPVA